MRGAFIQKLESAMAKDDKIIVLTADLGYNVFEKIQEKFPQQFLNVGVAEANMVGVAAGLAMNGYKVFTYSIVPFVTLRCFEQIRNSICYDNLNVTIIGVGGGYNYGAQGISHHTVEDIAIMRTLPNMTIVCPGIFQEAVALAEPIINHVGPLYLRLGKNYEISDYPNLSQLSLGQGVVIKDHGEIAIIVSGSVVNLAFGVADQLVKIGIKARIISLPTVKPLDDTLILKTAKEVKAVFTMEEHGLIGGMGSAVGDLLLSSGISLIFRKYGVPDKYIRDVGSQDYLRLKAGLTVEFITEDIFKLLKEKSVI